MIALEFSITIREKEKFKIFDWNEGGSMIKKGIAVLCKTLNRKLEEKVNVGAGITIFYFINIT